MAPQDPKLGGDALAAAMTDLVSRIPEDDHDLRARAEAVSAGVSTFVDRVRMSLAWYQFLFEEAPDPYLVTDDSGRITEVNAAARELLGASSDEIRGSEMVSFVSATEASDFRHWLGRLQSGEPALRWDTILQLDDGSPPIPVEISLADDLDGIGYRWVLREQQIRNAVEMHLRDVAESEHDAAVELRADAQVQAAFLIALSHDLRAPIGALVHQSQLLGRADLDPELRRRSLEMIEENARILAQLMEDLVDIERHAKGELELDRRETAVSAILDAIGYEGVTVVKGDDGACADVDLEVLARAIRAMIRATRRRTATAQVEVTGRVTEETIEILVTAAEPRDPGETVHAIRTIEARLTKALVEAHGGSVSAISDGLVMRLPRPD